MAATKLYAICRQCKEEIPVPQHAMTRPELEQITGLEFHLRCPQCGTDRLYHVNDVWAEKNKWYALTSVLVVAGVGVALLIFDLSNGVLSTVSFIVAGGLWWALSQNADKAVQAFNAYKL